MKFNSRFFFTFLVNCLSLAAVFAQGKFNPKVISEWELPEKDKSIQSFSGVFNDSISFHVVVNKTKQPKGFQSIIHFISNDGEYKKYDLNLLSKKNEYLSYHINKGILTLISRPDQQTIHVEDVHLESGIVNTKKIEYNAAVALKSDSLNVLINRYSSVNSYPPEFLFIKNANQHWRTEQVAEKSYDKKTIRRSETILNYLINSLRGNSHLGFRYINTGEYSKYGFGSGFFGPRGYIYKEQLYFLDYDSQTGYSVFKVHDSGKLKRKEINTTKLSGKVFLSYLFQEELFLITRLNEKQFELNIIGLDEDGPAEKVQLDPQLLHGMSKVMFDHKEVESDSLQIKKALDAITGKESTGKFLVVNHLRNGLKSVRLGDGAISSKSSSFSPSSNQPFNSYVEVSIEDQPKNMIEFTLNKNNRLLPYSDEYLYPMPIASKHEELILDYLSIKKVPIVTNGSYTRCLVFEKETNSYKIYQFDF